MAMHQNLLQTVAYDGGNQSRVEVKRQHFLHRLRLATTTGSLSGGSSGSFVTGAANKMIKRLELVIGGQLTKENISMEDLRRLNVLTYKDNQPSDGFAYLDLGRLPTHAFSSLELLITWETVANLNDGDRDTITGGSVDIHRLEEINEGQSVSGIPLILHKTVNVGASSVTSVEKDVRSGNVLQGVLVIPLDANGDPTDSLVETVTVLQDGVKFHLAEEPWDSLREDNKADFELDALPTGWAIVNFDKFGDGSQALRTAEMNTLEFQFALTSTADASIRLVPIEIATPKQ